MIQIQPLQNIQQLLFSLLRSTFRQMKQAEASLSQQTMDFKLPHVVVFACAKRDEPPSRRRPANFSSLKIHLIPTNSSEPWPTSARHSVSSVCSVDSS